MFPPSWTSPLPSPPGCHRALGWSSLCYSNFPVAICCTYGNVYVSMLLSQFVPPSPSPICPQVCSLSLYSWPTNRFISMIFLDFICMLINNICFSLSDLTSLCITSSESEVTQSCLTLCDPMDCSLPGSSVHGIFQAGILEWVAISFSRGSSWPRDWIWVSRIVGRCFTVWATREAHNRL